jgi:predicted RND superfamily exporter protein
LYSGFSTSRRSSPSRSRTPQCRARWSSPGLSINVACKNAILIVEFARELERAGRSTAHAAIEAAGLRLRPILMTSLAFIMGVLPLVTASGAGAEMRQAMGIAVFSGMIGATGFGLFLTPVFYVLLRTAEKWVASEPQRAALAGVDGAQGVEG